MQNKYVNIKAASQIMGYSPKTISRLIKRGLLPIHRASNGSQLRVWIYDIHATMIYNKSFVTLNDYQKDEIRLRANE
jgi:predicted site-specific integrase-resolvase